MLVNAMGRATGTSKITIAIGSVLAIARIVGDTIGRVVIYRQSNHFLSYGGCHNYRNHAPEYNLQKMTF
jgi:hypothetical protein